jgi:hypothetical protein
MQNEGLRNSGIGKRLAREAVARQGWTGTQAAFAVDREAARRELRADVESSGADYDPELEAAAGAAYGKPARTMEWSARLGLFVWWRFDASSAKWMPEGVEPAIARKLRVELSDANEGRSVEEVLAGRLEARE